MLFLFSALFFLNTLHADELVRYDADPQRLEACLQNFNRLPKGYFVLNAQEACQRYARVYPDATVAQCVVESMGARPNNRDYYTNYESMAKLCQQNPQFNSEQKKCIQSRLKGGGDVIASVHRCDPKVIQCTQAMETHRSSGGQKAVKNLYYEFCVSYPDDRPMGQCIADYTHSHRALIKKPKTLQDLCHEKARPCAQELKTLVPNPARVSADQLEAIASTCYNAFYHDLGTTWAACNYRHVTRDRFSFANAGKLCKLSNESARQCIVDFFKRGLTYDQSTAVCRHQSAQVRDCMLKYYTHQTPFATSPLREMPEATAEQYCALESEEERQCVVTQLPSDNAIAHCRGQSSAFRQCLADFSDYFDRNMTLNTSISDGRKICALPSSEMRLCLLNAIMAKKYVRPPSIFSNGNTWFPYDEYYEKCLGQFLGLLLQDTQQENLWPCRFQYFYSKSLWDKAWYCSYASTERVCREFTAQLREMSDADLRPECARMTPRHYNADSAYGNPLWHLCRERNLIPAD